MTISSDDATKLGTLAGLFLVALLSQYHAWKNQQSARSAAQNMQESSERRDRSLAMIHALCNSAKAALLEKLMDSTAQLAQQAPQDAAAQAKADWARKDYNNHVAQQSAIDAFFAEKDKPDSAPPVAGIPVTPPPSPTPNINTQPKGP